MSTFGPIQIDVVGHLANIPASHMLECLAGRKSGRVQTKGAKLSIRYRCTYYIWESKIMFTSMPSVSSKNKGICLMVTFGEVCTKPILKEPSCPQRGLIPEILNKVVKKNICPQGTRKIQNVIKNKLRVWIPRFPCMVLRISGKKSIWLHTFKVLPL